jgi:hypothetical protein
MGTEVLDNVESVNSVPASEVYNNAEYDANR